MEGAFSGLCTASKTEQSSSLKENRMSCACCKLVAHPRERSLKGSLWEDLLRKRRFHHLIYVFFSAVSVPFDWSFVRLPFDRTFLKIASDIHLQDATEDFLSSPAFICMADRDSKEEDILSNENRQLRWPKAFGQTFYAKSWSNFAHHFVTPNRNFFRKHFV